MRIFEIISVSTLLLTMLFGLFLPKRKAFGFCTLLFSVAVGLHLMLEDVRWQMFPFYVSAVLLLFVFFVKKNALRAVTWIVIFLFATASTALSLFFPVFEFQKPSGKYGVGTATYQFADTSRDELFGTDSNQKREILLQIWYPASLNDDRKPTSYMDDTPDLPADFARKFGYPSFVFSHLKYVKTHAVKEAKISSAEKKYPVIVYHSGLFGSRKFNTFLVEQLASQGYIVVGIDNPGAIALAELLDGRKIESLTKNEMRPLIDQSIEDLPSAPVLRGVEMKDGIIPYFVQDISFAIDRLHTINEDDSLGILTNSIDTDRVGVLGVSLGGIVVAEAAAKDDRIKACLIMESRMTKHVMKHGLKVPTMIMTRDAESMRVEREKFDGWTEKNIKQHLATMTNTFERLPADGYFVQIPGMFHIDFVDAPLWLPYAKYLGLTGSIETREVHNMITKFSVDFFDKELKNKDSEFLNNPTKTFPDVIYKKR